MNTRIFCRPKHCRVQTRVLHCNQLSLTQSRQNFDIIISTSLTGPRPFMWKPERESCVPLWYWGEIAWIFSLFFYSPFTILASFYLSFLFLPEFFFIKLFFVVAFFLSVYLILSFFISLLCRLFYFILLYPFKLYVVI